MNADDQEESEGKGTRACWNGMCRRPSRAFNEHDRTAAPSTCTVHAPQNPAPQNPMPQRSVSRNSMPRSPLGASRGSSSQARRRRVVDLPLCHHRLCGCGLASPVRGRSARAETPETPVSSGPLCLRGSGEVAPSAPRAGLREDSPERCSRLLRSYPRAGQAGWRRARGRLRSRPTGTPAPRSPSAPQ